jgi:ABC-type spermidine/putrescine transport system permease subunit II
VSTGTPVSAGTDVTSGAAASARAPSRRRETFDRTWLLWTVTVFVLVLMLLPVVVVVLFSLNSQSSLIVFKHPSLIWYRTLLHDSAMLGSLRISVEIAVLAAVASLILGTLLAFGMQRGSRAGSGASGSMVFLRLVTPETATAASLFLLFTQLHVTLSFWTIVVGHVALCTAFVAVVVRSQLSGLNREVEFAAQDLGARRLGALWLVVIPQLRWTLVSAGLLAFVLSFDDFVTTYFTAGVGPQPLPLRIYSMLRFGVTPEVNAAGIAMLVVVGFVLSLAALCLFFIRRRAGGRALGIGR